MVKSVYIACHLGEIERARALRESLRVHGFAVTSRWIDAVPKGPAECDLTGAQAVAIAADNRADIDAADVVVALLSDRVRGTLLEVGYAVGRGYAVVCVGPFAKPTPMLALEEVLWVAREQDAVVELRRWDQ